MERDPALGHQEPHWKEFHFDLTQIPAREAVTAAEFRIYKLPSTHPLNQTLHISMFEVVLEQSNRCLPHTPPHLLKSLPECLAQPWGAFSRRQKGSFLGSPPSEKKDVWPKALSQPCLTVGTGQHQSWIQVPILLSWLWDYGWVTELLSLSFPICTQTP